MKFEIFNNELFFKMCVGRNLVDLNNPIVYLNSLVLNYLYLFAKVSLFSKPIICQITIWINYILLNLSIEKIKRDWKQEKITQINKENSVRVTNI